MQTSALLADRFRRFASTSASRSPLYRLLSEAAADDLHALRLLGAAPAIEHAQPVLFFAALHDLVLAGSAPALGRFFATAGERRADRNGDPAADAVLAAFRDAVRDHAATLEHTIATRQVQTNEIGRAALFVTALSQCRVNDPIALLDVGASAGVNLRIDRYRYVFRDRAVAADSSSGTTITTAVAAGTNPGAEPSIDVECALDGVDPPQSIPSIARTVGIDRSPVDLTDERAVRWLLACVWPDQLDRFDRLVAALDGARRDPPDVRQGDAVGLLAPLLDEIAGTAHPVVTTSWVLAYLPDADRREFVSTLDDWGARHDLTWVIAESPAEAPGLPYGDVDADETLTALTTVRWRRGVRHVQAVGLAHPHGYWLRAHPARPTATVVPEPC